MTVLNFVADTVGQVGINPRIVKIVCDDVFATITAENYLQSYITQLLPTDIIAVNYIDGSGNPVAGFFLPTIDAGSITIAPIGEAGSVTLPVTANHIAVFTNTDGAFGDDAATAINGGNLQAGLSGTAGTLASFPSTASKGSLKIAAVANTGNTVTTISNAAMGQASVVSIPDPATATANFVVAPAALVSGNLVKASGTAGLVADLGASIKAATTAAYAGGGTSNAYTATGLTATSIVTATILAQTNSATIVKAVPGTNTLTVTFSADPGANTTVSYIAISAAV